MLIFIVKVQIFQKYFLMENHCPTSPHFEPYSWVANNISPSSFSGYTKAKQKLK